MRQWQSKSITEPMKGLLQSSTQHRKLPVPHQPECALYHPSPTSPSPLSSLGVTVTIGCSMLMGSLTMHCLRHT